MKKLLFPINGICGLLLLCASCHTTSKTSTKVIVGKEQGTKINISTDSISGTNHVKLAGSVGSDLGIKKDTLGVPPKQIAVIHGSPDQAKTDSIKATKEKPKKQ